MKYERLSSWRSKVEDAESMSGSLKGTRRDFITPSSTPGVWRVLCLILHAILVLLHIVMLVVAHSHKERGFTLPPGSPYGTINTRIVQILQAFITIYAAGIVATTQQLSLRTELLKSQTLTATHDKTYSWNGLGTALVVLWRQISLPASVWGSLSVALYLALIAVLHVTTPALLGLEFFDGTTNVQTTTTGRLPDFTDELFSSLQETASFLPVIDRTAATSTLGLFNSTLYEVLRDRGVGNSTVNATTFDVSCGLLRNSTGRLANSFDPLNSTHILASSQAPLDSSWDAFVGSDSVPKFSISAVDQGNMRVSTPFELDIWDTNIFVYASANVTDSQGTLGSIAPLNPPMILPFNLLPVRDTIEAISVLGCSLSWSNQKATIDAATNLVTSLDKSSWKTTSKWQDWKPIQRDTPHVESLDWGTHFFDISPRTKSSASDECHSTLCANAPKVSFVEDHLIRKITGFNATTGGVVALHDIENALASVTATLIWTAAQYGKPGANQKLFLDGNATMKKNVQLARLKLNQTPVAVGLGVTIVLLGFAILLSHNGGSGETCVDTIGVLELVWLLKSRPDLVTYMSEVNEPSIHNLRQAGMVQVRMGSTRC